MILCTVQDNEKYNVTIDGMVVGLYASYGYDPHLWNLVSRTAIEFFQYEPGFEEIPITKRAAILYHDKVFEETLEYKINGVPVRALLELMTPLEMIGYFIKVKPDMPIMDFFAPFTGVRNPTKADVFTALIDSMRLRAYQHKKYYKGKLSQKGKVIQVRFRPNLPTEQSIILEQSCKTLLKTFKRVI